MLPFGRPRFGGPVPAGLLAGIVDEAEPPTGVPTEDWDPGVEDRSLSKNEAIDDDRSLDGTLDCEEETCRDYNMEKRLNDWREANLIRRAVKPCLESRNRGP